MYHLRQYGSFNTGNKNVSCYTPHHQDKYVANLLYFYICKFFKFYKSFFSTIKSSIGKKYFSHYVFTKLTK